MGLDQYAYSVDGDDRREIAYWRKHNRLQGWMEELYLEKGGMETFNTVDVELSSDDIDALEKAIENREMPETEGYFFGGDSYRYYDDPKRGYREEDLEFVADARKALDSGRRIVYGCWY
tara:strand:+ start:197 stop:553 length:357 start_codon:yes stop_codon:yes gene_type:complete